MNRAGVPGWLRVAAGILFIACLLAAWTWIPRNAAEVETLAASATLLSPTLSNGFATIGAAVLLVAFVAALRAIVLIRRFAVAVSSHRTRAEFG